MHLAMPSQFPKCCKLITETLMLSTIPQPSACALGTQTALGGKDVSSATHACGGCRQAHTRPDAHTHRRQPDARLRLWWQSSCQAKFLLGPIFLTQFQAPVGFSNTDQTHLQAVVTRPTGIAPNSTPTARRPVFHRRMGTWSPSAEARVESAMARLARLFPTA